MKRLLILALFALPLSAQNSITGQSVIYQAATPSGFCNSAPYLINTGSALYQCPQGAGTSWTAIAGGGGGTIPSTTAMLKGDGSGSASAAVAGTDYQSAIVVNVKDYAAYGDGKYANDFTVSGSTATSGSASCTSGDVGKEFVMVGGNGATNANNLGSTGTLTITACSGSSFILSAAPTLAIPVVISNGLPNGASNNGADGCASQPSAFATLNGSGGINSSATITNTGTSGCSSTNVPTCRIVTQFLQSGSGAACSVTVSGGVVTAVTISGGSGYHGLGLYGHDDCKAGAAFVNAIAAATVSPQVAAVYVPPATNGSFYFCNTPLTDDAGVRIYGAGKYTTSWLLGDPGNEPLVSLANGDQVDNLRLDNIHGGTIDGSWATIEADAISNVLIADNYLTSGRLAIAVIAPSTNVRVTGNVCDHATDVCIGTNGAGANPSRYLLISDNTIQNTIWTQTNGQGHSINLEDCSDAVIANNIITENADSTWITGESLFQLFPNQSTTGLSNVTFSGNRAKILNPGIANTVYGFDIASAGNVVMNNIVVTEDNTIDGATVGLAISGLLADYVFKNSSFGGKYTNCGWTSNFGCIYLSASGTRQGITLTGIDQSGVGALAASGNLTAGGPGAALNRVRQIRVIGNTFHDNSMTGISCNGCQNSIITQNSAFDNSKNGAGSFSGIYLSAFTDAATGNLVSNNVLNDDDATPLQFGIRICSTCTGNRLQANEFPGDNAFGDIYDQDIPASGSSVAGTLYGSNIGRYVGVGITGNVSSTALVNSKLFTQNPGNVTIAGRLTCTVTGTITVTVLYTDETNTSQSYAPINAQSCSVDVPVTWGPQSIRIKQGTGVNFTTTNSGATYNYEITASE